MAKRFYFLVFFPNFRVIDKDRVIKPFEELYVILVFVVFESQLVSVVPKNLTGRNKQIIKLANAIRPRKEISLNNTASGERHTLLKPVQAHHPGIKTPTKTTNETITQTILREYGSKISHNIITYNFVLSDL